jgi:hypothetical protein
LGKIGGEVGDCGDIGSGNVAAGGVAAAGTAWLSIIDRIAAAMNARPLARQTAEFMSLLWSIPPRQPYSNNRQALTADFAGN